MHKWLMLAAVIELAGCSTIQIGEISAKSLLVAAQTFDAAKLTAKNYLILCAPNRAPVGCNDTFIQTKLVPAIKMGTTARNNLEPVIEAGVSISTTNADYQALTSATSAIKSVVPNS